MQYLDFQFLLTERIPPVKPLSSQTRTAPFRKDDAGVRRRKKYVEMDKETSNTIASKIERDGALDFMDVG